ncbi:MAG TPA: MarR family transcriptional regulator [Caldilineaceae bacterium]|nr:MarR family transcriptional regulator [Caldilineaceae bacterium]
MAACTHESAQSLGYLLAQICKTHRNRISQALASLDLHAGQEIVLFHLWGRDGVTQSELAESVCLQPATVTRMLGRMEQSGLIVRHPDPEDQRISRVCLTPAGRALEQPVIAAWEAVEQEMMRHFSLEERLLLRRLLLQLYANLMESEPG